MVVAAAERHSFENWKNVVRRRELYTKSKIFTRLHLLLQLTLVQPGSRPAENGPRMGMTWMHQRQHIQNEIPIIPTTPTVRESSVLEHTPAENEIAHPDPSMKPCHASAEGASAAQVHPYPASIPRTTRKTWQATFPSLRLRTSFSPTAQLSAFKAAATSPYPSLFSL